MRFRNYKCLQGFADNSPVIQAYLDFFKIHKRPHEDLNSGLQPSRVLIPYFSFREMNSLAARLRSIQAELWGQEIKIKQVNK